MLFPYTTKNMLLYPGAFHDISPVLLLSHSYENFIFYDGMPNSKYFTNGTYGGRLDTLEKLLDAFIVELKLYGCYDNHEQLNEDSFKFTTRGGQKLYVFWNTTDDQIYEKPILKDLLGKVTTLYIKGYSPSASWTVPSNITEIYTTAICHDNIITHDWVKNIAITIIPDGDDLPMFTIFCNNCHEPIPLFDRVTKHPKDISYTPKFPHLFEEEIASGSVLDRFRG